MRSILTFFICFSFIWVGAQNQPPASAAADRIASGVKKTMDQKSSIFRGIKAQNIGPTVQSGRVVDLEVYPKNPHIFYVAYASGGLWKTENNGASFSPLFQQEMVMTIGDFDVNWETGEIWLGSGEVNSSRSSYSGVGVFYSKDWGESWEHKGLDDTHHIGKVIIDPADNNTIYVAALGHLYSSNAERGVFISTDKGTSWKHSLDLGSDVGLVDLIQDPKNEKTLYAAAWERTRRAWDFTEAGEGSGIYKSTDGGENWNKISGGKSGFPGTTGTGRIGLSMTYDKNNQSTLYALLDNYDRRKKEEDESDGLQKDDFKSMSKEALKALSDEKLESFLRDNGFQKKYTAASVKADIEAGKYEVKDIAIYLEDANRLLFDTPVKGAELYRSIDGGKTWKKTHDEYLDRVYNSYGYYFGLVRTAPGDPSIVYIGGVPLLRSTDGGVNWENVNKPNVHADHHSLWINPQNHQHIINGNDGGINISYDGGDHYFKCNSPTVGQFYAINVDMAKPYNVYGGLQDNGVWMGSHQYVESPGWHQSGQYPYKMIMGGDGMKVAVDTRDNETVYTGFQFGNYFRLNTRTNDRKYITPKHDLGSRPYRWNWQSPVKLSSHNQDIVYMGANKLLRSMDQGDNFTEISGDLTRGGRKGDVAYGTLSSFSESPLQFGLIYTGSDDGKVFRTDDGGATWIDLTSDLPQEFWVSRIEASHHDKDVVYLSLNGYRWDDFRSLVYRSTNRGKTWEAIGTDLPMEPVNVIKEDPHHANILYVGTDHGTYISMDTGKRFSLFSAEIPKVAIHDLVIHPREKDLLIGTHGRSIYKADLEAIYSLSKNQEAELLVQDDIERRASSSWGDKNWLRKFNEVEQKLNVYSKSSGEINIELQTKDGEILRSYTEKIDDGFNEIQVDFTIDGKKEKTLRKYLEKEEKISAREDGKIYLPAGEYQYVISKGTASETVKVKLK